MATTPHDLERQQGAARALLAAGLEREEDRRKLLKAFKERVVSRRERLTPGRQTLSPYMQLAYDGLFRSDAEFLAALIGLDDAKEALATRFDEWTAAATTANANLRQDADIETADIQEAREHVVAFLELADVLYTYAVGAAYVVDYELLLSAHNANAVYLGEKAWSTHKWKGAGRTVVEGFLETGLTEWAIPAGAGAIGVVVPPALVVSGVLVAAKVVVDLTKRQAKVAEERLAVADQEAAKMYVLQRFNEQGTDATAIFTQMLVDADQVLAALLDGLQDAVRTVIEIRYDVPGLIQAFEVNEALSVGLRKIHRPPP